MSKIQQILEIHATEEARFPNQPVGEVMRWAALIAMDEGFTSSDFADAMETIGVKRGTALNRWSDMKRNVAACDEAMNG